jgi:Sugar (and other) transporter
MIELLLCIFIGFYSFGPGVCVWLALSELMPTRIRSNGMSIALVINQLVSTTMAGIFLPVVSRHGYSTIFLLFGCFTAAYFFDHPIPAAGDEGKDTRRNRAVL